MSHINRMMYDSQGHTGLTYYALFVVKHTGESFDWVADALAANPTRPDSAVLLGEVGTSGKFPIVVPTNLPTGKIYDVVVYLQAGTPAANTDDVQITYTLNHGSIFGV